VIIPDRLTLEQKGRKGRGGGDYREDLLVGISRRDILSEALSSSSYQGSRYLERERKKKEKKEGERRQIANIARPTPKVSVPPLRFLRLRSKEEGKGGRKKEKRERKKEADGR